jgi:hypothetical protein
LKIYLNRLIYPKKTDSLDYNQFSPYTPIPYYVSDVTKYQHHHIDLVDYLNKNQLNLESFYYSNYHNSYEDERETIDYHDIDLSKWIKQGSGEEHHHGHHGHNHGQQNNNHHH